MFKEERSAIFIEEKRKLHSHVAVRLFLEGTTRERGEREIT